MSGPGLGPEAGPNAGTGAVRHPADRSTTTQVAEEQPLALRSLARRSAIPVTLDVRLDGRLPEPVEVAAYYVVSEMLTNAAKHARASVVEVSAALANGRLQVCVHDDGVGGADPARGSGLVGLKDRVEAIGGTLAVDSPPDHGTTVRCALPLAAGHGPAPASASPSSAR